MRGQNGVTIPIERSGVRADLQFFAEVKTSALAAMRSAMALCFVFALLFAACSAAQAETRTLKIYHVHTGERQEITFKRNGVYVQDGLNKLNRILRDWRHNEPTRMDPRLFDTVWEVYQKSGSNGFINVVCGYRSGATNSMLRKRSKGVAEKSQHIKGKAMDFYIPGVSLKKLRYLGLQLQAGGVGYYPRSGSPFVHLDVGSVRHWPKMSRSELMAVFPTGKTMHVPSDGRPLSGYNVALASYKSRIQSGSSARFDNSSSGSGDSKPRRSLFAVLFGGGADEEEDTSEADVAVAAAKPKPASPAETLVAAAPRSKKIPAKPAQEEVLVAALPQRTAPAPLAIARPSQDLNQAEPFVETEALAFAVPVPAKKPRANPILVEPTAEAALAARMTPEADVKGKKAMVQMASVDPAQEAEAIRSAFGANEPAAAEMAQTAVEEPFFKGNVPLPMRRPAHQDEFMVASVAVPEPRPVTADDSAPAAPVLAMAEETPKAVEIALVSPPKPSAKNDAVRELLTRQDGIDPEIVADTGVKTTDKGAKPKAADAKKARKLVVVPVTEDLGKFALTKDPVTKNGKDVAAVTYNQESVWVAPTEVYVAGFSADVPQNVNTFSGKAVNFLKVAKFKKAK
jgi:uncharacterized protein YcbK (DUF882 family)